MPYGYLDVTKLKNRVFRTFYCEYYMTTIMFLRSISRNIFTNLVYYYGFLRKYKNIKYYSILSLTYT